jgi:hypothetical protein
VAFDVRSLYEELAATEKRIFELELELHQKTLEAENMGQIIQDQQAKLDAPRVAVPTPDIEAIQTALLTDGAHHKQFCLVYVLKTLLGEDEYQRQRDVFGWGEGVAP